MAAARALEEISSAVEEVHNAAEEVEREAVANRAIVEQLGERTQEVSQAASEHASASEEVTAAAEEQTASTEEMAASAGELLQGATRLTAMMQEFKTWRALPPLRLRRLLDCLHLLHRLDRLDRPRLGPGPRPLGLLPIRRPIQPPLLGRVDLSQDPVALVLGQEPAPGGVADQLVGVRDVELGQAGGGPDDAAQGVRHRTPQHVGDPRQGLQQRRDL